VAEVEKGFFLVSRDLRVKHTRVGSMNLTCAVTGAWAFNDEDFKRVVSDVLKYYDATMGGMPRSRSAVFISPFPTRAAAQEWSAEARGGNVVVLSGQSPSKPLALARLDNVLSHELLHLWVPNGLSLEGEYGWFYEGFTLYLSLRAGVRRGHSPFRIT
jgi:hypothetical protein